MSGASSRTKNILALAKAAFFAEANDVAASRSDESESESEAESELTEEQVSTLKELDHLINDWSQSPIHHQIVQNNEVSSNPSICRNLFKDTIIESNDQQQNPTNIMSAASTSTVSAEMDDLERKKTDLEEARVLLSQINSRVSLLDHSLLTGCTGPNDEELKKKDKADKKRFDAIMVSLLSASERQSIIDSMNDILQCDSPGSTGDTTDNSNLEEATVEAEKEVQADDEKTKVINGKTGLPVAIIDSEKIDLPVEINMNHRKDEPDPDEVITEYFQILTENEILADTEEAEPVIEILDEAAVFDFPESGSSPVYGYQYDFESTEVDDAINAVVQSNEEVGSSPSLSSKKNKRVTYPRQKSSEKKGKKKKNPFLTRRQNFCMFCKKLVTNFTAHIQRETIVEHQKETYLAELEREGLASPRKKEIEYLLENLPLIGEYKEAKASKKKLEISTKLRGRGNFLYNKKQAEHNFELLPTRRLAANSKLKSVSIDTHVPCSGCGNLYLSKTLYRHKKYCKVEPLILNASLKGSKRKIRVLKNEKYASNYQIQLKGSGVSDILRQKVWPIFQNDVVALVAKNDRLICLFGSEIIGSHLAFQQLRQVTNRMRDLARLLIELRELDSEIKTLADALKPHKFKHTLAATQKLSGYNAETGYVNVVTFPTRISTSLKLCIQINLCDIIENENTSQEKKLEAQNTANLMETLFKARWAPNISSNAEKTKKLRNSMKKQVMPDNQDIKLLIDYLEDQQLEFYSELQLGHNLTDNYDKLCKCVIALIILYNRRRAGETARIELQFYQNNDDEPVNQDIQNSLNENQQKAMKTFSSFHILGKNKRTVPVLITKQMRCSIDLLIELRSEVGIDESNPYLFAKSFSTDPYDGTKILREFRSKISLKNPAHLTSTGLRHNIATMSAVINVPEENRSKLADSMGHDFVIHRKNYSLPQQEVERGVVGEILLAAARGKLFESAAGTSAPKNHPEDHGNNKEHNENLRSLNDEAVPAAIPAAVPAAVHSEGDVPEIVDLSERKDHHSDGEKTSSSDSEVDCQVLRRKYVKMRVPQQNPPASQSWHSANATINTGKKPKKRWSNAEKKAIKRQLSDCMAMGINPKQQRSEACINAEPILAGRTWIQVNGLINNYNKGKLADGYFSDLDE